MKFQIIDTESIVVGYVHHIFEIKEDNNFDNIKKLYLNLNYNIIENDMNSLIMFEYVFNKCVNVSELYIDYHADSDVKHFKKVMMLVQNCMPNINYVSYVGDKHLSGKGLDLLWSKNIETLVIDTNAFYNTIENLIFGCSYLKNLTISLLEDDVYNPSDTEIDWFKKIENISIIENSFTKENFFNIEN